MTTETNSKPAIHIHVCPPSGPVNGWQVFGEYDDGDDDRYVFSVKSFDDEAEALLYGACLLRNVEGSVMAP